MAAPPMTMYRGLHEQLITRTLADALDALRPAPIRVEQQALDPADSHELLAAGASSNGGSTGSAQTPSAGRRGTGPNGDGESDVGSTRIQGALKNVGHRAGRSTIARILKAHGLPPVPERRTSWQTFLRAHWGAIAGADFFTTEVWTWRGLVTFYTVFVIDLASRRVEIPGSTPHRTTCLCAKSPGH